MIEYIQIQLAFKCGVHHQKLLKNSMRGEHGTQLPFGTQTKQDRKNGNTQSQIPIGTSILNMRCHLISWLSLSYSPKIN